MIYVHRYVYVCTRYTQCLHVKAHKEHIQRCPYTYEMCDFGLYNASASVYTLYNIHINTYTLL